MITTLNVDEEMGTVRYEVVYVVIFYLRRDTSVGLYGFDGVFPSKDPDPDPTEYRTTFGDDFGRVNKEVVMGERIEVSGFMVLFDVVLFFQLRREDAPPALGRSGRQPEKGKSSSGLIGENFRVSDEPSSNTIVQRSWLYTEDSAIKYRTEGVPQLTNIEQTSLPGIG